SPGGPPRPARSAAVLLLGAASCGGGGGAGGGGFSPPYQETPALMRLLCAVYIHTVRPPRQKPVMPSFLAFAFGCLSAQPTSASRSASMSSSLSEFALPTTSLMSAILVRSPMRK